MESYTTHPEMCVIEERHSSGGSCVPGKSHYLKVFRVSAAPSREMFCCTLKQFAEPGVVDDKGAKGRDVNIAYLFVRKKLLQYESH